MLHHSKQQVWARFLEGDNISTKIGLGQVEIGEVKNPDPPCPYLLNNANFFQHLLLRVQASPCLQIRDSLTRIGNSQSDYTYCFRSIGEFWQVHAYQNPGRLKEWFILYWY